MSPILRAVMVPELDPEFRRLIAGFPTLLMRLKASLRAESAVPQQGVYAFYERGRPLYVGRSNKLRRRAGQHRRQSGSRYNATFAFKLARSKYKKAGHRVEGVTRATLEKRREFKPFFKAAKMRVSKMELHAVSIPNQRKQAFFELYAQVVLKTKRYNSFGTY